ncbi:hypothetical protein [Streptomyces katsurahamanus]|uniref:FUSC family protein n=1 Tax=Streptomyces katsurahamanus TaxID=2577098 RepID=A0ABW9NWY3_9ACTN|nr:hypothetical protein [Streptomyces katsurahamanus]MQS37845.1 hypothetical protein [Streptomyces katsurahamanus]
MFDTLSRDGRWGLALVCACYLMVVYITSRGLIAAPRYRLLQGRIRDCRARASVLAATGEDDQSRVAVLAAVHSRLNDLEKGSMVAWRLLPNAGVIAIPLSKLASAWRVLHGAERELLRLESAEETAARTMGLRLRLAGSPLPGDPELAGELSAADPAGPGARAQLIAVTEYLHDREDTDAEQEYEQQRMALWLTMTGLGAVLVVGIVFDHRLTMLMGALGGFLSPLIGVMRSQRPASWGVMVLAPVGGALAAAGGLLLVRMLADPELNLLGEVFLVNSWDAPERPIALALALLFGFSGTLFSRLALTATGQLEQGHAAARARGAAGQPL